jgi:hypothetical protein
MIEQIGQGATYFVALSLFAVLYVWLLVRVGRFIERWSYRLTTRLLTGEWPK